MAHDRPQHDDRSSVSPGYRPPSERPHPEATEQTDVRRRIELEATPDEVWRAFTDPEELASWWGKGSELDATVDGEGLLVEEGEPVRRARVVEVRPGRRLVLDTWPEDPDSDDPATRITIELSPSPLGTVLTVLECVLLDLSELPVLVVPRPTFLPSPWGPGARRIDGRALARV